MTKNSYKKAAGVGVRSIGISLLIGITIIIFGIAITSLLVSEGKLSSDSVSTIINIMAFASSAAATIALKKISGESAAVSAGCVTVMLLALRIIVTLISESKLTPDRIDIGIIVASVVGSGAAAVISTKKKSRRK